MAKLTQEEFQRLWNEAKNARDAALAAAWEREPDLDGNPTGPYVIADADERMAAVTAAKEAWAAAKADLLARQPEGE